VAFAVCFVLIGAARGAEAPTATLVPEATPEGLAELPEASDEAPPQLADGARAGLHRRFGDQRVLYQLGLAAAGVGYLAIGGSFVLLEVTEPSTVFGWRELGAFVGLGTGAVMVVGGTGVAVLASYAATSTARAYTGEDVPRTLAIAGGVVLLGSPLGLAPLLPISLLLSGLQMGVAWRAMHSAGPPHVVRARVVPTRNGLALVGRF